MISKRSTVASFYNPNDYQEMDNDNDKKFPAKSSKDVQIKSYSNVKLKPLKFGETEAVYRTSVGVLPLRNR